ncbi:MAG: hypothetical protein LBO80_09020 [Treponema sp.]|nr:hypothetical protein [Treponema sp.]
MRKVIVVFVIAFSTVNLFAQTVTPVLELNDAINNGQVTLTANGSGGSSGMVINGFLQNLTSGELRINVIIDRGIYLINSGSGQNMVGTQIYHSGGRYFSDGSQEFIILQPRVNVEVSFMAFCADLERDNPSSGESFSTGAMPPEIRTIAAKINRYMREHPGNENAGIVAQLALWRSQNKTRTEIAEHFRFTHDDWDSAGVLLSY